MTSLRRVLVVTLGLSLLGGIAGAIAGSLVAVLVVAITEGIRSALDIELLGAGAAFGAPLGAVLLPIAGWLLMRRVPLGRAMLGTMLGSVAGGLVGWFTPLHIDVIGRTLLCGLLGFALSVLALRRTAATTAGVAGERSSMDVSA